jgi:hypothetical protein
VRHSVDHGRIASRSFGPAATWSGISGAHALTGHALTGIYRQERLLAKTPSFIAVCTDAVVCDSSFQ